MKHYLIVLLMALCCLASCVPGPRREKPFVPVGSLEKGREYYMNGEFAKADAEFNELLSKNSADPYAHYYLGLVNIQILQTAMAREHFVMALQLNPSTEFCNAIQEILLVDNSRVIGSGKGFWFAPVFLDVNRVACLVVTNDTDGDGNVSPSDNASLVHVQLASRKSEILVDDKFIKGPATASFDGKKLTYASIRRDTNGDRAIDLNDNAGIYVFDIESRKETCIVSDDFQNSDPSFSPDGKIVYFVSIRIDNNLDRKIDFNDTFAIYRFDTINTDTRKVHAMIGDCRRPMLSSDGRTVFFWAIGEDANEDGKIDNNDYGSLYRYNMDTPSLEPVLGWRNGITPFNFSVRDNMLLVIMEPWSGEGVDRNIAIQSDPKRYGPGLYKMNLVTQVREKVIEQASIPLLLPNIAPDGHTIAFQRSENLGTSLICYYFDMDKPYLTAEELIKVLKSAW